MIKAKISNFAHVVVVQKSSGVASCSSTGFCNSVQSLIEDFFKNLTCFTGLLFMYHDKVAAAPAIRI